MRVRGLPRPAVGAHAAHGRHVGNQRPARLHRHDAQCRHLRVEAQFRALARGPLRVDCSGVADLAADEVLQPLVAVEPAAVRADLRDPRPYALGGRVDLDGVRLAPSWFRDQFVTRIPGRGRSPPAAPAPAERGQQRRRHDGHASGTLRDITPSAAPCHHRPPVARTRGAGASAGTTGCTKHHPAPHVETRPAASQPSAPSLSGSATAPSSLVKSATACPGPASALRAVGPASS